MIVVRINVNKSCTRRITVWTGIKTSIGYINQLFPTAVDKKHLFLFNKARSTKTYYCQLVYRWGQVVNILEQVSLPANNRFLLFAGTPCFLQNAMN